MSKIAKMSQGNSVVYLRSDRIESIIPTSKGGSVLGMDSGTELVVDESPLAVVGCIAQAIDPDGWARVMDAIEQIKDEADERNAETV